MNAEEQTLWVADVSITLDTVVQNDPSLDDVWYEKVMHVAAHVAQADSQTLREAFMILTAQRGDGPDKAHSAIVAADLLLSGRRTTMGEQ